MPAKPTWHAGRRHRREGRRRQARDEGHLPARPARLGPGLRPADHRGQHLRRHLVRPRTGTPQVNAPEFTAATNFYVDLVRAHGENGRPAGRLHRVPEQPRPGQGRHVVRRDLGRRLAGGAGLPGEGQDRLRAGAGGADEELRLALRLVLGHPAGQPEEGRRLEVHLLGVRQEVREPRRLDSSAGPRVPAGKRASTYENPDYLKVAAAFAEPTRAAIASGRPGATRACSRARRSASSSSTSPSSPTSAPRSRRTSARPSPGR